MKRFVWFHYFALTCLCVDSHIPPTPAPVPAPTMAPVVAQTEFPPLRDVGNNGSPSESFPLGECEGDCDNDNECEVNAYMKEIPMILATIKCSRTHTRLCWYDSSFQSGGIKMFPKDRTSTSSRMYWCWYSRSRLLLQTLYWIRYPSYGCKQWSSSRGIPPFSLSWRLRY